MNEKELVQAYKTYENVKALRFQLNNVVPNIEYLSAGVKGKGNPQSLFFNADLQESITAAGRKQLELLLKELESFGISLEESDE